MRNRSDGPVDVIGVEVKELELLVGLGARENDRELPGCTSEGSQAFAQRHHLQQSGEDIDPTDWS